MGTASREPIRSGSLPHLYDAVLPCCRRKLSSCTSVAARRRRVKTFAHIAACAIAYCGTMSPLWQDPHAFATKLRAGS